jgi:hypothetical protein
LFDRYPKMRSCCFECVKLSCSGAAGFLGAAFAAEFGKGFEALLLIPPELAGFMTAGGVVYGAWSLVEFMAWRRKRRKARKADDGGSRDS